MYRVRGREDSRISHFSKWLDDDVILLDGEDKLKEYLKYKLISNLWKIKIYVSEMFIEYNMLSSS